MSPPRVLPTASSLLLLATLGHGALAGQGLPPYRPVAPALATRSVLGFQPVASETGRWQWRLALDYANAIELSDHAPAYYLFDAELARLELTVSRRLGTRWTAEIGLPVESAFAGMFDGAINWWHGVFGMNQLKRDRRPPNEFGYQVQLPGRPMQEHDPSPTRLGDLRLALGLRHSPHWQTTVLAGLPTSRAGDGYGLDAVATGIVTTFRSAPYDRRAIVEGGGGLGYTPRAGPLAEWQRQIFVTASTGLRVRFWGQQWVYANAFYHSAGYHSTSMPVLDREDVSLDFGFLLNPGGGPELVAGMVQDLYSFGPAVDLVLRLGARW